MTLIFNWWLFPLAVTLSLIGGMMWVTRRSYDPLANVVGLVMWLCCTIVALVVWLVWSLLR